MVWQWIGWACQWVGWVWQWMDCQCGQWIEWCVAVGRVGVAVDMVGVAVDNIL